jgi:hypothetical protein
MAIRNKKQKTESINQQLQFDTESLLNDSRQELIELAKNLSDGKYQKNSRQRTKLMQLLVKQIKSHEPHHKI